MKNVKSLYKQNIGVCIPSAETLQGEGHPACAGSSEATGTHADLPASLQPGTEPHRVAMAQNEV
jgi:hypothetical protein